MNSDFEHGEASCKVLCTTVQGGHPLFLLQIRMQGPRSLMPDKVGDKFNRFVFPQWWLVFQRKRNFQCMKGHYCLNGDKSLEEHGGCMIFGRIRRFKSTTYAFLIYTKRMFFDHWEGFLTPIGDGRKQSRRNFSEVV